MSEGADGTVARTLKLIGLIAEAPDEISVKALATRAGLPPSTVHRLLGLLIAGGYAERAAGRRYRIGAELFRVARLAVETDDLPRAAYPFMRSIVDACDETCLLGAYRHHDQSMSFVARVDCSQPLRYRIRLHASESLAADAAGLAILAFLPEPVWRVVGTRGPRDPAALSDELDRCRTRGHVVSRGGLVDGAVSVSAPVFAAGGHVVASLTISLPDFRFAEADAAGLAEIVAGAAAGLSRALGKLPGTAASLPAGPSPRAG